MANQNAPKKETVRITLPPRAGAKPPARERPDTVRINLPARPPMKATPSGLSDPAKRPAPPPMMRPPLPAQPAPGTPPAAPPPRIRPPSLVPPAAPSPSRDKSDAAQTGMPDRQAFLPPAAKNAAPPANLPPPPMVSTNSGAALTPLPPPTPAVSGIYPGAVSSVSSGPKKETARISLVPEPAAAPSGAVNMKKTQPLITAAPPIRAQQPMLRPTVHAANLGDALESVPLSLCWALVAVSALTFLIQIWNYFVA